MLTFPLTEFQSFRLSLTKHVLLSVYFEHGLNYSINEKCEKKRMFLEFICRVL